MQHEIYFLEADFFVFWIFFVRGIVDNIKEMTNNKVIETSVQYVRLDSSSSPNDIVKYEFNLIR